MKKIIQSAFALCVLVVLIFMLRVLDPLNKVQYRTWIESRNVSFLSSQLPLVENDWSGFKQKFGDDNVYCIHNIKKESGEIIYAEILKITSKNKLVYVYDKYEMNPFQHKDIVDSPWFSWYRTLGHHWFLVVDQGIGSVELTNEEKAKINCSNRFF